MKEDDEEKVEVKEVEEEKIRQKEERNIYLQVKQMYNAEKKEEGQKNVSFAEESQVYELKQSPGVDNSHSLDNTFEYVDPPEPVLNLHTPELKSMEYKRKN